MRSNAAILASYSWNRSAAPSHPDVAHTVNNLALVYLDKGKYGEAKGLFERALAIRGLSGQKTMISKQTYFGAFGRLTV